MNTIQTANMLLPVPVVGQDAGPDYALNVNASLALIDSHNHSPNQGVPINPNGLNINADLPIGINNLTLVRSLRFSAQASPLALSTDLGCLYESGVDLYYNDGNGNQIRITQSGAVTGATGTITGLPSGTASASFSGGTFTWQSATSTAANMDFQSAVFRNSAASSFGLTLSAPTLTSNISLVFPQIPSQNATFLQLDTSGNITAVNTADGIGTLMTSVGSDAISIARTRQLGTTVAAGGIATSVSSAGFAGGSTSFANITNLSVTITTSGRPVCLMLIADGGSAASLQVIGASGSGTANATIQVVNVTSSTNTGRQLIEVSNSSSSPVIAIPASSWSAIDYVSAGTYNYQMEYLVNTGSTSFIALDCKLVAYEL